MSKAMAFISKDLQRVASETIRQIGIETYHEVRTRAEPVKWSGAMLSGIRGNQVSNNHYQISSNTKQGYRFETGFVGVEPKSDLLSKWFLDKFGIQHFGKSNVNYANKTAFQFMKKSIPTQSEIRKVTDAAVMKNMKGGIING